MGWGRDQEKRFACYDYVYDPVKRVTLAEGWLGTQVHFPHLRGPVGPDGLIVGMADDFVFSIDPRTNGFRVLARDEPIPGTTGFQNS